MRGLRWIDRTLPEGRDCRADQKIKRGNGNDELEQHGCQLPKKVKRRAQTGISAIFNGITRDIGSAAGFVTKPSTPQGWRLTVAAEPVPPAPCGGLTCAYIADVCDDINYGIAFHEKLTSRMRPTGEMGPVRRPSVEFPCQSAADGLLFRCRQARPNRLQVADRLF